MTPLVTLDGDAELTFTDVFCGAGGSSIGLTEAGFTLRLAANHWDRAIETHSANFRDADHLCADVSNYDWRRAPRTVFGWFSPECTWHSPAGGRKKTRAQLDMFDDYVPDEAGVRSRATAFDVIRATEVHQYRALVVENVVEFAGWELFDWWLEGLRKVGKGYNVQIVCVSSAHVGDEVNPHAPQWRDRMYIVATQKGIPLPDVAPRPPAWCPVCDEVVDARQSWKKVTGRKVGKYGEQYVYRCPNRSCRHAIVEPYVLPASAAIDWTDLGTRLGDKPVKTFKNKKTGEVTTGPLAPATMRRIRAGLEMFAQPTVVAHHGQTWERPGSDYVRAWPAETAPLMARTATQGDAVATPGAFISKAYTPRGQESQMVKDPTSEPLGAVTAADHHQLVAPPFAVNLRHGADDHGRQYLLDGRPLSPATTKIGDGLVMPPGSFGVTLRNHGEAFPVAVDALSTVSTSRHDGVVVPFIDVARTHNRARGVDEPLSPVTTGRNHGVVVPEGAFIQKHHGGLDYKAIEHMTKSVGDPLPGIVARPNLSLVIPYRRGSSARPADATALPTVSTRESAGVATAEVVDLDDVRFRMLKPREHLAAQRFPGSYVVTGNQGEQTMQAGNAVSANVAHWLGRQILAVLR
ncbi:DNA cytosine methyltransferase [Blastococcus sp. CT_GayMR16]|uniref:DNA cytosine methyltransferase n=1 Tax=Blastococcus sp. CT_GayMR16 TaxID=2559607 RepID=UPI001073BA26|nr:DNA cytosine methyltransferase [Blastococcus sp. CT_GayMR16]TFV91382.1 DNA cytosine methyltransferase [Blastococcus sp. CT_GayMR16]